MPTIIGHHNITKGQKHWLTSPKRKELFGPLGVTNIRTFVDPQNPTRVAVLMDVPDMDALMAAMQSKAAADAMASDGVVPESLVILVEILKVIGLLTSGRKILVVGYARAQEARGLCLRPFGRAPTSAPGLFLPVRRDAAILPKLKDKRTPSGRIMKIPTLAAALCCPRARARNATP